MKRLVWEANGRVRLAWRLLYFTLLFFVVLSLLTAGSLQVGQPGLTWTGVNMLAAALLSGWIALRLDGRSPAALGMWWDGSPIAMTALGLLLGLLVAGVTLAIIAAGGGIEWSTEPGSAGAWWSAMGWSFLLLFAPAASEEALLRGYPLQAFAEKVGRPSALAITSLVFAGLHFWNPEIGLRGFASITAAGLFLGTVYFKTASLWAATGAHLAWNWALGFWADLPVSGLDLIDQPFLVGRPRGPDWWSGGAFGPEGSWVATVVLALAALWLWRSPRLTPRPSALTARPLAFEDPRSHVSAGGPASGTTVDLDGHNMGFME